MSHIYGIDLGTTYTKCALVRPRDGSPEVFSLDRDPEEPDGHGHGLRSAVAVSTRRGGDRIAHVGVAAMAASDAAVDNPSSVRYFEESKLWIGKGPDDTAEDAPPWPFRPHDWEYRPEDIGALVLKKVRCEVHAARAPTMERVVVTHPQYFKDARRLATIRSAEIAGLKVVDTITEPNAAALAFGVEATPGVYMVFDLGGGTLDVTIARIADKFDIIGDSGLIRGGRDFDTAIVQRMLRHYADQYKKFDPKFLDGRTQQRWYRLAEATKKILNQPEATDHVFVYACQNRYFDGMDCEFTLSRNDFIQMTRELVDDCIRCARKALEYAGLRWSQLTEIVCVGGSTRLDHLRTALREASGKELLSSGDPDTAVVRGAALYAHRLAAQHARISTRTPVPGAEPALAPADSLGGRAARVELVGRLPAGLGVLAWSARQNADVVVPLIKKGAAIPCKVPCSDRFRTTEANATSIEVVLCEGDSEDPRHCDRVGKVTLNGLEPGPPRPVAVTLEVEANGTKHLIVAASGKRSEATIEYDPERVLPEHELQRRRAFVDTVEVMCSHA